MNTPFSIENRFNNHDDNNIVVFIRPEDIILDKECHENNALPCDIKKIHYRGSHYEMDCNFHGNYLKVIERKTGHLNGKWKEKKNAFMFFNNYRVFHTHEGHEKIQEQFRNSGYVE